MSGRSPSAAVKAFIEPLQASASCVTKSTFQVSYEGYSEGVGHSLTLNRGEPSRLRVPTPSGVDSVFMTATMAYDVIRTDDPDRGPFKVSTAGYWYHVLDESDREVILFHWHPSTKNRVRTPHLHIGGPELLGGGRLRGDMHMPTGRVAFEQVVSFLIDEIGVIELRPEDGTSVLGKALARFREWGTWHH